MLKVGLILYSVREEMAKDPLAAVERVAGLGYRHLEVCNHNAIKDPGCGFGVSADTLKASFDKLGAQVVSAHIFPMEKADLKAVFQYNRTLGNGNIVNPMGRFTTYDDLMHQCEFFNKVGKACHEGDFTFLYHNHDHEFRTFNGKSILDYIVENTDPQYLSLELDTFWVMRAGFSPVEMLKHFGKRVKLVHQKDFAWDSLAPINTIGLKPEDYEMKPGESAGIDGGSDYAKNGGKHVITEVDAAQARYIRSTAFTEIGMGIMPIQEIIDAANAYTSAEYIILEQDATRMESQFASVQRSMQGFRQFKGIEW